MCRPSIHRYKFHLQSRSNNYDLNYIAMSFSHQKKACVSNFTYFPTHFKQSVLYKFSLKDGREEG